ncbi:MAG: Fic family protein [Gammaproteobacteria bacterium]|nr:Fic family protein [Gammaproteobacteria bacterium]
MQDLLLRIDQKRHFLSGLASTLDTESSNRALAELSTQETVATSAIEGVKLDPNSVRSSIMRRLGLGVSREREERIGAAAKGVIDVLADSTQNLAPLTLERLLAWHSAIFPQGRSGLTPLLTGEFRGAEPMQIVSGAYGREKVHYQAPPRERLDKEVKQFLKWLHNSTDLDATLRACIAHLWFETLHPFEDGNGRLGRAISDLTLAQGAGFHSTRIGRLWAVSPVFLKRRKAYYDQLERAQKGNLDITEWLQWSASAVEQAYDDAQVCIHKVGDVARFWTQHRDRQFNERQRRALEVALSSNTDEDAWLTARRIVKLTKVAPVTASRDLAQLEEWGVIRKDPNYGGRSTRYAVVLSEPKTPRLLRDMTWK